MVYFVHGCNIAICFQSLTFLIYTFVWGEVLSPTVTFWYHMIHISLEDIKTRGFISLQISNHILYKQKQRLQT